MFFKQWENSNNKCFNNGYWWWNFSAPLNVKVDEETVTGGLSAANTNTTDRCFSGILGTWNRMSHMKK